MDETRRDFSIWFSLLLVFDSVWPDAGWADPHGKGSQRPGASPKLLGLSQAMAKQLGTGIGFEWVLKLVGDSPTISLKVRLKVPRLEKPTSRQISVTSRLVWASRNIALSTRRRCR